MDIQRHVPAALAAPPKPGSGARPLGLYAAVVAAVIATALALVDTAAEADRLDAERIATGASTMQAGARYAAFRRADGDLQVIDTQADRTSVIDVPDGCLVFSLGGGYVSFPCGDSLTAPRVYRLSTGEQVPVRGWEDYLAEVREHGVLPGAGAIGRRWMEVYLAGPHLRVRWFLRWRTGELVTPERLGAREVIDLNGQQPTRELCRPLQRRPLPPLDVSMTNDPYDRYLYDRPWGATQTNRGSRLERCGRDRSRRVPCNPVSCNSVQLGSSAVSWAADGKAHIRELPCGREHTIVPRRGEVVATAQTRNTLFASAVRPDIPAASRSGATIYQAPRERSRCR